MNNPADTAQSPDAPRPMDGRVDAAPQPLPVDGTALEMRQVAGLTAGSVTNLRPGTFQFHESETEIGFAVTVRNADEVFVVPGQAASHVDEIPLDEPTPLNDSVLNVGSACFTVRRPRPAPTPEHRLAQIEARRHRPGPIVVPELAVASGGPTQSTSHRFGTLFSRRDEEPESGLDPAWWRFLEDIRDTRSRVAERHRWLHPDPEELRSRLERMDPGLWDRGIEHPLFGRVALAYATIPWEPHFDAPERIPPALHGPIREMSRLPWVPVTANLHHGPLGIAGSRAAVLAASRYVLLSLCSLTAPADFALSIVTAKGLVGDWSWTSALPNSMFPDGSDDDGFLIAVADGMTHFEGAGFSHEAVLRNEMGLVAIAETPEELPEYCATVLVIAPDGRCQVRNHMGEQVVGTPIGVTADLASRVAAMITAAVGDTAPNPHGHAPPPERPARDGEPAAAEGEDLEADLDEDLEPADDEDLDDVDLDLEDQPVQDEVDPDELRDLDDPERWTEHSLDG